MIYFFANFIIIAILMIVGMYSLSKKYNDFVNRAAYEFDKLVGGMTMDEVASILKKFKVKKMSENLLISKYKLFYKNGKTEVTKELEFRNGGLINIRTNSYSKWTEQR